MSKILWKQRHFLDALEFLKLVSRRNFAFVGHLRRISAGSVSPVKNIIQRQCRHGDKGRPIIRPAAARLLKNMRKTSGSLCIFAAIGTSAAEGL
ncbi:hypothetical protein F2P79_013892 [Pimephales promelas]|nr:hypothetical protein F2P79_013892 [Pimephales promelas]